MESINTDFENRVNKFWNWFGTISKDLLAYSTRADLFDQIDLQINKLGDFDWELGSYKEGITFLAISPKLDRKKLDLTFQIIKLSPKLNNWIFLPSKPVKEWQGIWKMKNHLGKEIQIDSSNWEYVLYQFEDNTFDIDIKINDIDGDSGIIYQAVDIALTGYLGEELFMNEIINIDLVDDFEKQVKPKATKLIHIKEHLESLQTT